MLTFRLSASQVPLVPDMNQSGVFSEEWFGQVGFILMGMYALRLLFSFTVRFPDAVPHGSGGTVHDRRFLRHGIR